MNVREDRKHPAMDAIPAPSRVLLSDSGVFPSASEEAAFFASLHHSNGTARMTSSGRLTDINAAIARYLPVGSCLEALDVGISSGITTVEWLISLEGLGHKCAMTAFDRVLRARLYRFGRIEVLAETRGRTLLIHTGHRAFTRPTQKIARSRNRLVRAAFRVGDVLAWLCRGVGAGCEVRLVSARLRSRPEIRLVEHDLFNPAPEWMGRFHLVRVANLLNRGYFSEPILCVGLRNASNWVKQGGLLVVAQTEPNGQNHATMFRREATGLRAIHRLGSGSEVETLVTSIVPARIRAHP